MILLPALQQSLIFLPLALAIFISYRVLNETDLTVDGTFVMGAALFARLMTGFHHQVVAVVVALIATGLIGVLVAYIHRVAKISILITSILTVFMLYTVNFKIMGDRKSVV